MAFDLKKFNIANKVNTEIKQINPINQVELVKKIDFNDSGILHVWQAPEFEVYEKSRTWYLIIGLILLGIITYALVFNNPIMAIVFILIGVVGYLYSEKQPRILDFAITSKGILAGKYLYEFENMDSFWIFYDPPHTKTLSINMRVSAVPFVHIPLEDEDPTVIRDILIKFIPEEKQETGLLDAIERFLHL